MTVIYDEENVLKDLLACFQANFTQAITCVNTVKNDSITLEDIPLDMWSMVSLDSSVLNYRGFFIMYGFVDNKISEVQEDNWLEPVATRFEVCTFDNGERDRSETLYKLIRYRRALKDVLIKNPDVLRGYSKPLARSLEPTAFPYPGTQDFIISVGLDIQAMITAS